MKAKNKISLILLLSNLPKGVKNLMLMSFDVFCLSFSFCVSFMLVTPNLIFKDAFLLGSAFVLLSLAGLISVGVYKAVIRFSGIHILLSITCVQLMSVCITGLCVSVFYDELNLVLLLMLLFLLSVFCLGGVRLALREIIYLSRPVGERILVYGAEKAGIQILTSIRQDADYNIVGFVSDDEHLRRGRVHGVKVFPSSELINLVREKKISIVVLAVPNINRKDLRDILDKLEPLSVIVKKLPNISDLMDGKNPYEQLQEIKFEELLGREKVAPNEALLRENITGKVVLVTGAGGSIGSELCRQIVTRSPKKLILVDLSELALFNIEQELVVEYKDLITPVLGSVVDFDLMCHLLRKEQIQTVYHAAAYKHVPLVESNPFAAIHNNFIGTQNILRASVAAGVSSFTLISTDKAVRPTNVMGSSKRLAEIACQVVSKTKTKTKIAIVRFGNVIGSSGSAIPKFRQQIRDGGPVTVTHPDITRYFMLIPEAVELVLQASSLAKGGDVFVLDMGAPIKIAALVKKLIRFSGNRIGNLEDPRFGAINIEYLGLRPGEKLYEELLISGTIESTIHPKIKRISELHPEKDEFGLFSDELLDVCKLRDEAALTDLLSIAYVGYTSNSGNENNMNLHGNEVETQNSGSSSANNYDMCIDGGYLSSEMVSSDDKKEADWAQNSSVIIEHQPGLGQRLFLSLLHKYFLLSRPLTMGVRCLILDDKNKVLLVEHTYVDGWFLPGGGVDSGESVMQAVEREVAEETGFHLSHTPTLIGIYHANKVSKRDHVAVFLSRGHTRVNSNIDSFEIRRVKFFSPRHLPKDIDPDSRKWTLAALELDLEQRSTMLDS
ncbi:polysaccharide biosynthesis protein [Luminiphilus sp.]|nr:polysaccharide biosynthesis protein [Luminiphilus sp.]MDB2313477.1 polysaccharide biosynthesis protein [Luminiphilus sp.]